MEHLSMENVDKSAMGRRSRNKGKRYERSCANDLKPIYGANVKRGWQSRDGSESPDVDGTPFWVECKAGKKPNPRAALKQAIEATDGRPPLVIIKDDRQEAFALMRWPDMLELLDVFNSTQNALISLQEEFDAIDLEHRAQIERLL